MDPIAMNLVFLQIAVMVLVPVCLALAGWLMNLSNSVHNLRILVAERYVSREVLHQTMEPILEDVEFLKRILIRVADKFKVSTE